jgi:hypothetical protein
MFLNTFLRIALVPSQPFPGIILQLRDRSSFGVKVEVAQTSLLSGHLTGIHNGCKSLVDLALVRVRIIRKMRLALRHLIFIPGTTAAMVRDGLHLVDILVKPRVVIVVWDTSRRNRAVLYGCQHLRDF